MNDIRLHAETFGDRAIDVVPGVGGVGGDVEVLAERLCYAKEFDEWRGEIGASRQRPGVVPSPATITGLRASMR